jgi:cytoskeletal protein CcmA (bactofilin family)
MQNEKAVVLDAATPAQSNAQPAPALPREERRVAAWIGKSVIFKGDLISSEEMTIDGRVEGTIEVRGHGLTIGPDADIRADIVAESLNVLGAVTGSITAKGKVDIAETGSVEGAILALRLAMAEGAKVRGQVAVGPRHGGESAASQPGPASVPDKRD